MPHQVIWDSELFDFLPQLDLAEMQDPEGQAHGGVFLTYGDLRDDDRDQHGVLWMRAGDSIGKGAPRYGSVHPRRQRRAMTFGLCQVCGVREGAAWMIPLRNWNEHLDEGGDPSGPFLNAEPPTCASCIPIAAAACPSLSKIGYVFLRPAYWANVAMEGYLSNGDPDNLKIVDEVMITLPGVDPPPAIRELALFVAKGVHSMLYEIEITSGPEGLGRNLTVSPVLLPSQRDG